MHRKDFLRLAGADQQAAQYLPIALLLRSGYGCAGYYNTEINHGLDDIVVLLNARLIALNNRADGGPVQASPIHVEDSLAKKPGGSFRFVLPNPPEI